MATTLPPAAQHDEVRERPAPLASARSKDVRARRSAVALRQALLQLLETTPYEHISIRDICAAARVHYATYFRHFPSKEALLDSIAVQEIADLNRLTLAKRGADDYRAGFVAMCRHVDAHRRLWTTLLNGGAGAAMREEWLRQSRLVAHREEPPASWLPPELGVVCATALIAETLAWWLGPEGEDRSVGEIADVLFRLLTTPIIALPAR